MRFFIILLNKIMAIKNTDLFINMKNFYIFLNKIIINCSCIRVKTRQYGVGSLDQNRIVIRISSYVLESRVRPDRDLVKALCRHMEYR